MDTSDEPPVDEGSNADALERTLITRLADRRDHDAETPLAAVVALDEYRLRRAKRQHPSNRRPTDDLDPVS